MLLKSMKNTAYWRALLLVGILTLGFALVYGQLATAPGHNVSMLKGMLVGLGSAFTAIGGIKLLKDRRISEDRRKAKEIELKDERNIEITRIALSVSSTAATLLFAVLSFVLVAMDYIIPAFMAIGAMYIQLLTQFIAYSYFSRKM